MARVTCAVCERPESVCWCAHAVPVENRTPVLLLQHPREARVPINTGRIARSVLRRCTVRVGVDFSADPFVRAASADPDRPAVLLFPDPAAGERSHELPREVTLVVVDGTWSQARKMVRRNPWLAALPRLALSPAEPSRYRIRREPSHECVSTIEAISAALARLDGGSGDPSALLRPFDAMVETQLDHARRAGIRTTRHRPARPRPPRPYVPRELLEAGDRVVLAYGEANAWPRADRAAPPDRIVHWAAVRPATGERFEAWVRPDTPIAPSFAHHTGLDPARLLDGEARLAFAVRWGSWLRADDLLVSWGTYALGQLDREGIGHTARRLDLRAVMAARWKRPPGEITDCALAFAGTRLLPPWPEGRTGRRLSALAALHAALVAENAPQAPSSR